MEEPRVSSPPLPPAAAPSVKQPPSTTSNEGDWPCTDCGNINFARRTSCNRCHKSRGPIAPVSAKKRKLGHEIGKAAAEKSRGLFSADDWQCNKCGNVNWARRQQCNVCNAPKFGEVEERTGFGGGYNDRGVVEYKEREESDDEYDEFGRKKKKKSRNNEDDKEKEENDGLKKDEKKVKEKKVKDDEEEEEEEEEEDEEEEEEEEEEEKKVVVKGRKGPEAEEEEEEAEEEEDDEDGDLSKYDLSDWGDTSEINNKNVNHSRDRSRSSSSSSDEDERKRN